MSPGVFGCPDVEEAEKKLGLVNIKLEEEQKPLTMEVQMPMLHHNPYDMVKTEHKYDRKSNQLCQPSDVLFNVPTFQLQGGFGAPQTTTSHDVLPNGTTNHRLQNGRSLAADRKRPYPCPLCTSRFGSKMELEEHQNSHTGQKPFECDVCKARFNRRSTLWNHKRIHSDAKPFVCTVCQMTFKWKNSLKCHKEMHLRKNESSAHLDHDLKQLTYATAAKRRLMQMQDQEENGSSSSSSSASTIHSQPLITTTTPKKKSAKVFHIFNTKKTTDSLFQSSNTNNNNNSVVSAAPSSHLNVLQQPLQASALIPPSDHQLDLDTSSLDTLVNSHNHGNLLMHMYGDMDGSLAPRHATSMLSGLDESGMLTGHILGDGKSDFQTPMGGTAPSLPLPFVSGIMQIRPVTQLPSVHHLTSTALPSVSVDYCTSQADNVSQPQYIVTQPDMMNTIYQQPLDQCVILTAGQDYMPNFDYQMLSHYQLADVNADQQQQQQVQVQQQMQPPAQEIDEKVLPYEQW